MTSDYMYTEFTKKYQLFDERTCKKTARLNQCVVDKKKDFNLSQIDGDKINLFVMK